MTRSELEARLQRPDEGENGWREGAESLSRLEALDELRTLADRGQIAREGQRGGINTHVHTSKSFAYFASPAAAAWAAWLAGIDVFGINDHYTIAGHGEFREACALLGIRAMFSMEAVAMWEEAEQRGETVNDPSNPGRTYLTAKGVTRELAADSQGRRDLDRMNAALLDRNERITAKMAALFDERLGLGGKLTWAGVLALTPHGQPTERHICEHAAEVVVAEWPERGEQLEALTRLAAVDAPEDVFGDAAKTQNWIRAQLVKAGKAAYVEESTDAFIPLSRMVTLALDLGAIPMYPVLGNPVTPWEEDIDRLFDRLEAAGIYAIEVIPDRNTRERLRDIVHGAAARSIPVVNGTEHNTKTPAPLVDQFFFDDEFRQHFDRGARVVLGHQALRARGDPGYVDEDGSLPAEPREDNLRRCEDAAI